MIRSARPVDVHEDLEELARDLLREAQLSGPFDPYRLIFAADYEVRALPGITPTITGRTIWVRTEDPPFRQRFSAVHEFSHKVLEAYGLESSEWSVNWLASALIHERRWFLERVERTGWDLAALRRDCQWSSHEAIGRRVVNLGGATLWVCDRGPTGRRSRRHCSAGTPRAIARGPTRTERRLVELAARDLRPQRLGMAGAWALPRRENGTLRVISLARTDELLA